MNERDDVETNGGKKEEERVEETKVWKKGADGQREEIEVRGKKER